jgi:hypothetical protein
VLTFQYAFFLLHGAGEQANALVYGVEKLIFSAKNNHRACLFTSRSASPQFISPVCQWRRWNISAEGVAFFHLLGTPVGLNASLSEGLKIKLLLPAAAASDANFD